MSLRVQLFIVSLLTLLLPLGSCQFARHMEQIQRQVLQDALNGTAQSIARTLPAELNFSPFMLAAQHDKTRDLYAFRIPDTIVLDGFSEDWELKEKDEKRFEPLANQDIRIVSLLGKNETGLYLHLAVVDDQVVYADRPEERDTVVLRWLDTDFVEHELKLGTLAPGGISENTVGVSGAAQTVNGFWVETTRGYNLEVRLPIDAVGVRLGFLVQDVDEPDAPPFFLGSISPSGSQFDNGGTIGVLRWRSQALEDYLSRFDQPNLRIRIVDQGNWLLAESGSLSLLPPQEEGSLLGKFYRSLLLGHNPVIASDYGPGTYETPFVQSALSGLPARYWSSTTVTGNAITSAAHPITISRGVVGALVLERAAHDVLLLGNKETLNFINRSLLVSLFVALVLLGYASFLSVRIRRLRNATDAAMTRDGSVTSGFQASQRQDELGDLSRSFEQLLTRVHEHTDYLQSLSGRLSHELRTPLTIVQSSLDSLQDELSPQDREAYIRRAKDGVKRLTGILSAMSEASYLEQSINQHECVDFDLVKLLEQMVQAFSDLYPDFKIVFQSDIESYRCFGCPDLISQLMDKLLNNAIEFSNDDRQVTIRLNTQNETVYQLAVINKGQLLPNTMTNRLFDSMVSVRKSHTKKTHLGLGLYIVKLIVSFHKGQVTAKNLADKTGVQIEIKIPKSGPKSGNS